MEASEWRFGICGVLIAVLIRVGGFGIKGLGFQSRFRVRVSRGLLGDSSKLWSLVRLLVFGAWPWTASEHYL